uniref:Nitric oxide synthase n=1 Tax=Octopus bimaculoides TaxID=37653 RepID=A0A6G5T5E5_OCTBM|nr:Nitric Oxide Synthase 1b [Octopus bimaculoides]
MANEGGGSVSETIRDDKSNTNPAIGDEKKTAAVNDVVNGTPTKSRSRSGSRHNLFCENTGRGSPERRGSSPVKYCKLKCYQTEKVTTDMLHLKSVEPVTCTPNGCKGSIMFPRVKKARTEPRPKEEVLVQAKAFMDEYFSSIRRLNTPAHQKRWQEVMQSIEKTGTYDLTKTELTFGAKTAWRNAPRCIGRIQWSKLQVFDCRHITSTREMFEAICNHIKYGTNKGNIRSAITIFPQRTDGKHDFRIWNAQIIRYAGYKNPDDTVTGDPVSVEFTEICQKIGWKGKGGMFDILPLVLQADGQDPEWYDIPPELVLEIAIKHPTFEWFEELGLKWFAFPGVSNLLFDCGGLEFTAAPFNGWYMGTEIGSRNLCDESRYNLAKVIGKRMNLDINRDSSLWKDRVLVETNLAILHSFQSHHVTISDHHTAAESFMKHFENEQRLRNGCPADWVWIVPPMSGSVTPVYHQEMLNYVLKPSYDYMVEPWKTHVWKKDREKCKQQGERPKRKFGFRDIARAVKFSAKLMGKALARRVKCTIMYGTETGKSERFAKTLCEIFKHAFDAKMMCMEDYDITDLEHEALVLMVTSTFGNGDPPENGWSFANALYEMKSQMAASEPKCQTTSYIRMSVSSETDITNKEEISDAQTLSMESGKLSNVRYSVFGLGSRAYPNFCAFGHYLNKVFSDLGAERVSPMIEGDELSAQEESFKEWANAVFKAACDTFCLQDDVNIQEATGALHGSDQSWSLGKYRLQEGAKDLDLCAGLSAIHAKHIAIATVVSRQQLQSPLSDRETILLILDTKGCTELSYLPGDHLGIYPPNDPKLVEIVLSRLHNAPPIDQLVKLEMLQERSPALGPSKSWTCFERFPPCTLRTAFTRYLDIMITPSKNLLQLFSVLATDDFDRERLDKLSKDAQAYEQWKQYNNPNLPEVLQEFPSLYVPPTLLMTQLPLLQQRFYSVSSSPKYHPGEIHLTIAIAKYVKPNGKIHNGVCTTWLNSCPVGEKIPCIVRAAPNFHMPEDDTRPIIMVGPGSGIAPFRSFWQQRKIDKEMLPEPRRMSSSDLGCFLRRRQPLGGEKIGWGNITLYFGCRNRNIDNIYEAELEAYKKENVLQDVCYAFSREPGTKKTYVQHMLAKNSKMVSDAIVREGGHFYVCGDVQMASDVSNTIELILREEAHMTAECAKNYVLKLRDANRFHEDIFGVTVHRSTPTSHVPDKSAIQSNRNYSIPEVEENL